MRAKNKKAWLLAALAVVGAALMLFGSLLPTLGGKEEKSELESRFEQAITKLPGISKADVIIQKSGDLVTGAVAVCVGGSDADREVITNILCSGLDLPSNRIYVVCN